jgi:hypothetical protein
MIMEVSTGGKQLKETNFFVKTSAAYTFSSVQISPGAHSTCNAILVDARGSFPEEKATLI